MYLAICRAATPMRTPRSTAPGGADRITLEAQNLARLQAGQTPLMGGANPELHPSDFAGVTPRNTTAATPHPMATPQIGASPFPGATPGATPGGGRSVAGISATPMRTPLLGASMVVTSYHGTESWKWHTQAHSPRQVLLCWRHLTAAQISVQGAADLL